jgi:outer membrane receptor protein involved in Fe transport
MQNDPKKTDLKPLSPKKVATLVGTWLAVALSLGQAAEPALAPSRQNSDEAGVVLLSPFMVNSDKDVGYQASSTLAGTRLATSLKDIGSSISIYTKSFLNDIGATNANDLLVFGAGTEAAGAQGNYSGAAASINTGDVYASGVRTAPQNATRIRGLASPSYSRGLFNSAVPIDSFNVDSVTVNRGANAILFGVGSPSGVVNTTLTQANLLRNLNKIEFRYGNNDSSRSSLDLNRVLVPKKLALRLAAVDDDERYNQRPAFDHKRRIYGTVTAKPFTSTTLRGSFESGNTRANRPLNVLPMNSISPQWYATGRPTENWLLYDNLALNPNAASQSAGPSFWPPTIGTHSVFDHVAMVYSQANATTVSNSFRSQLLETTDTLPNRVRSSLFHPLVNRDLRPESTLQVTATRNIVELTRFAFADANGVAPAFVPAGIKRQGFTDFSSFDYKNEMLDQTGGQSDSHHSFNLTLEQLAWKDRLGVELSYNSERYDRRALSPFLSGGGNGQVKIDTSVSLPTGQPNPNVGRPFLVSTQTGPQNTFTRLEAMRATAFARYNFKDLSPRLGRWLGRHSLTGLYERQQADTVNYFTRLVTSGVVAESINTAADNNSRQSAIFVYLGDSILNGAPLRLNPIKIPTPVAGLTAQTTYFSAPAGSTVQGDFATAPTTMYEITPSGRGVRDVLKSQAFVLQSHWLRDHIVTTLGWRRDEDFFESQIFRYADNPAKVHRGFNDFKFASTPAPLASKEIKSYSVVLHWPQQVMRLPLGGEAGFFFNRSENFTPSGGAVNVYNQPLPSPQGTTREFGLTLSFLNEKFVLRVNRFETSVKGQSFSSQPLSNSYNNAVFQDAAAWAQEQNLNPNIDRTADIELLFSALPANFRQLYNWRVTGSAAQRNLSATYTLVSGVTDTTDYTAKGTEAEFTYSPNAKWRFLGNVANQETVQTNVVPGTKEFRARMKPVWDKLANVPAFNYPVGHVLGTPLPANVVTHGQYVASTIDPALAAITASEGSASAEQRKWRANLVASYTFAKEGRLKGWSVGTGVRWQDKIGVGYPASRTAAGAVIYDITKPYFSPAETNVDLFASYTRKIWNNRIEWRAQLNVRNAIGEDGLVAVTAQPWGETAISRLAPERRWYLTNSFGF